MLDPRGYCFGCMNPLPSPDGKCPVCGWNNQNRKNGDDQLPFALLARKYFVGRALGRGGFGITYIGLNEQLAKRVAIKEYYPDGVAVRAEDRIHIVPASPDCAEQLQEGINKALEEARTIARIQSVPNVVRIYDCFSRNSTVYIVMEYIDGETLIKRVDQKGRLSWQEAWSLMKPIGEALNTLHQQGLIHRDISPDNIMISKVDGSPVLLDFGAARSRISEGEAREKLLKDGYAAPEQYQEQSAIDGRADEYAWAATFLYALTGKRPGNALQRQFGGDRDLLKGIKKGVPYQALEALRKALSVNPADRYASMSELLETMMSEPEKHSRGQTAVKIAATVAALCLAGSLVIGLWGG